MVAACNGASVVTSTSACLSRVVFCSSVASPGSASYASSLTLHAASLVSKRVTRSFSSVIRPLNVRRAWSAIEAPRLWRMAKREPRSTSPAAIPAAASSAAITASTAACGGFSTSSGLSSASRASRCAVMSVCNTVSRSRTLTMRALSITSVASACAVASCCNVISVARSGRACASRFFR